MADNAGFTPGSGDTLRMRDTTGSGGPKAMKNDVAPWLPTVVSGAQYNLAISSTAVTLTVPSTATHVLLTVETNDIRFTEDGSTPTASNGLLLKANGIYELPLPNALKLIRVSADAVVQATYRKYV